MALAVATTGLLNSCTKNEALVPDENVQTIQLLKAPDVLAYSGKNVWGSTLSTRTSNTNANMYNEDWDCVPNVDLNETQLAELIELFKKGEPTSNNVIFPYENYWVQQVYKGEDRYTPTDINGNPVNGTMVTGSDQMNQLGAWNPHTEMDWSNWPATEVTKNYEHVNNFNNGNNTNTPGQCGCGITHLGTTLMVDMPTEGITPDNQFAFQESYGTKHDYCNYIIINYPEGSDDWYVGFDYEMHKDEAKNANEPKDIERDWNFTDWIVKITPAYHIGEPHDKEPEIVGDEEPETPGEDPEEPETPVTPAEPTDEVEINLSVNEHNDYLESKLSIHVRAATDVEVFIPIGAQYYVQKDDMNIVGSHFNENLAYGGNDDTTEATIKTTIKYNVGSYVVTLTVAYEENNGIRITTDGINEEVIAYCRENFHDGITFEVWNYFNNEIAERSDVKEILDNATVEFLDKFPDLYVNAFNKTKDGDKFEFDCTVDIVDTQKGKYNTPVTGKHLNGSPYNQLYHKVAE